MGDKKPDRNDDEPDKQDETWCLFDGKWLDDEIYSSLGEFPEGVRVLVFSDSCHSGTAIKKARVSTNLDLRNMNIDSAGTRYRVCLRNVSLRTYRANKEFCDKIQQNPKLKNAQKNVKASCMLISGCQDNQLSADGDFNGLFTANLLEVWKEGAFRGDYKKFHSTIQKRMPPHQSPNYFVVGLQDPKFEAQQPFTI